MINSAIFHNISTAFDSKVDVLRDLLSPLAQNPRHQRSRIFFFDELHALFKEDKSSLPEIFKTMLADTAFFIGATTEKEYQEFIANNPAFDNRFIKIPLQPSSPTDTYKILADYIQNSYPELEITPAMIDRCIELSEKTDTDNKVQPEKALLFFSKVAKKASELHTAPLEKALLEARQEKERLLIDIQKQEVLVTQQDKLRIRELLGRFQKAAKKVEEIQKELDLVYAHIENYKRFVNIRKQINTLCIEINKKAQADPNAQKQLYFLLFFVLPALKIFNEAFKKQFQGYLPLTINEELLSLY